MNYIVVLQLVHLRGRIESIDRLKMIWQQECDGARLSKMKWYFYTHVFNFELVNSEMARMP